MARRKTYGSLSPDHRYLSDTAVLVQAWKKAHTYIRSHSWYADSLELDSTVIRLPDLVKEWSTLLRRGTYKRFSPNSMRLVPAPKSMPWDVTNGWAPTGGDDAVELRPLSHLTMRDQTLAMAFLLCLAEPVEISQGNPDLPAHEARTRGIVSYGHRLICSWNGQEPRFRWGNAKLYRQYYTDYQTFVQRPEEIRDAHFSDGNGWAIAQVDLSKFYDRISRVHLIDKLSVLIEQASDSPVDQRFFGAMTRLFDWKWHPDDVEQASVYFPWDTADGLPQGLAASGFFANVYLLDFDRAITKKLDKRLKGPRWTIVDYCRYVDDMRFVLRIGDAPISDVQSELERFVQRLLDRHATGLRVNPGKTQLRFGDNQPSHAPIADAMQAIDAQVSGPLDVPTGRQALELLDGLLANSAQRRATVKIENTGQDEALLRLFSTEPDVRNETVERFVAHRWKRVFRTLRVMSDAEGFTDSSLNVGRAFLDQRAEAFSAELIRRWIEDPSNVRLLLVAMDIYPAPQHLTIVLNLLESYFSQASGSRARAACAYVGAELLRAGATMTGFVHDGDELPAASALDEYRARLAAFAKRRLSADPAEPWYVAQQALLFLAVVGDSPPKGVSLQPENRAYYELHELMQSNWPFAETATDSDVQSVIPLLLLAHRLTGDTESVAALLADLMSEVRTSTVRRFLLTVLTEDDTLLDAVWRQLDDSEAAFWRDHFVSVGYFPPDAEPSVKDGGTQPLLSVITSAENPFRQETAALRFLLSLLDQLGYPRKRKSYGGDPIVPSRIEVTCSSWDRLRDPAGDLRPDEFGLRITSAGGPYDHRYEIPEWCSARDRWRIEVGQILRAAILGNRDYSQSYHVPRTLEGARPYHGIRSSWYKRKHGLYSGRGGLGDHFLPMSPWISELLCKLLAWPGTEFPDASVDLQPGFRPADLELVVRQRLSQLAARYCRAVGIPCYDFPAGVQSDGSADRAFRVAVVQTVLPKQSDFERAGWDLSEPAYRRKHRRHASAMLRLVMNILDLRAAYKETHERIDLVVFPELAIHADDMGHMVRFADATKCMIFCGMVFHPHPDRPSALINSGMWVLPVQTPDGRSIQLIEQGKYNLTPDEQRAGIVAHRPCQWVIEGKSGPQTWRLSAAMCYDATDLRLAADLRDNSDAFIVSALNQDTGTFDSMVAALHYHMYQHIILVNTGEFGGTTAQAPYKAPFKKLIVHHHGADVPMVSVVELDLCHFQTTAFGRAREELLPEHRRRKHPPAGYCR